MQQKLRNFNLSSMSVQLLLTKMSNITKLAFFFSNLQKYYSCVLKET